MQAQEERQEVNQPSTEAFEEKVQMEAQQDAQEDIASLDMELEMEPTEFSDPNQLVYDMEDRGRSQTMSVNRSVKLMSELIKN